MNEKQLEKKVEWLESEKRDADKQIKVLIKSINKIETANTNLQVSIRTMAKDLALAKKEAKKTEDIPLLLKEDKAEANKKISEIKQDIKHAAAENKTLIIEGQRDLKREILSAREELGQITSLQSRLKEQADQELRLDARITNIETGINEIFAGETARQELALALEEHRKSDDKRISEAKGVIDAVYQKMESSLEQGDRVDIAQKKLTREFEIVSKDQQSSSSAQSKFIQKISADQIDKNHALKDWGKRLASIYNQSAEVKKRLNEIESLDIAMNRSQSTFDLLIGKINRRVNELTEIQRIGEQRFRKEWSTFQADSEKKWTSHTLNRQELSQEATRERGNLDQQITVLEKQFADLNEKLEAMEENTVQFLQSMFEAVRNSLS
jgi:chromosome segregation ATPase